MEGLFFAGLICGRLWRGLLQGLVSAPARRGLLFCEEKWAKEFWGRICDRLRRGGDFAGCKAGTPTRRGPTFVRAKVGKTRLGLCPKTPLPLSCGWIRTMRSIVRTAPQIRSQGACGAFYFGPSRNQIKNQPYKRRRVGRNLRLSRADPALCSGQPSPLRCILLSPQGLATLRGPRLYGVYRRVGSLGRSPE